MSSTHLVGMYDQQKASASKHIDEMVAVWRNWHDQGLSDFDIFGRHIVAMHRAETSAERLAVLVAFMVERLAAAEVSR